MDFAPEVSLNASLKSLCPHSSIFKAVSDDSLTIIRLTLSQAHRIDLAENTYPDEYVHDIAYKNIRELNATSEAMHKTNDGNKMPCPSALISVSSPVDEMEPSTHISPSSSS